MHELGSPFLQNSQQGATASFKSKTVRTVFGKGHSRKLVVAPLQKPIRSGRYIVPTLSPVTLS